MRTWGGVLICVGVVWLLIAFNMDTSVSSDGLYGTSRVENIGLIAQRQNHLLVASLITLIGTLMAIFGGRVESNAPDPARSELKAPEDPPCERDLDLDPYRLWLTAKYEIKRNDVFDRFVYNNHTFETLDAALESAHAAEMTELTEKEAAAAEREAELQRLREERAADTAKTDKQLKIGALIFLGFLVVISPFLYQHIQEAEKATKAAKAKREQAVSEKLSAWGVVLPKHWKPAGVREVTEDQNELWCDYKAGTLLEYDVQASAQHVVDVLKKSLGTGIDPFSGEEPYSATGSRVYSPKNGYQFHAYIYARGGTTSLHLCATSTD